MSHSRPLTGLELADALTLAAQQLHETSTTDGVLRTAVRLAVDLLPGAEYAGISAVERAAARECLAWSDELVRDADALDPDALYADGVQPPYWDRLWNAPVVRIDDSASCEDGEPPLSGLGLRSALALRLRADRRRLTALTLYSRKPRAFDDWAVRTGRLFTAHVSIALETVTMREQLTEAMRTRDLIGQATGILMERLNIDAEDAFDSLVRTSQRENVKLRDLARRIVGAMDRP
ncbi:ANTAR domain-containing protein [Streptomyces sp. NPDC059786]|uniref:ANTAR domain-containing protein n=1 Tax=Streptomyces sp. NPDC059786 TaxID=3346946 RepID=UPI00364A0330